MEQQKMEKDKRQRKMKKINIDLPRIQNKAQTKRGSQKENVECQFNVQLSPKIKNLRKLFFQYRSNARILQKSPYYINNAKSRHKLVEMISTRRYDMNHEIQKEIIQKYGWHQSYDEAHAQVKTQKKELKIKLHYDNRVYSIKVQCSTSQELKKKLTVELAKIMYSVKNTFKKCDLLLCFQTVQQNHQLDFILSNQKLNITFLNQLNLRPVFSTKSLPQGQKISLNDFKFIKCLGNGGFSTVYLVRGNFDNKYYALKLINKNFIIQSEREGIVENERFILGQFNFPLVTQLQFAFETKNHFVLVIQYCPGGQLFYQLKKVKRMKQSQAKFYFLQILVGLDYIHSKNIVYRDLKPQNLLIGIDGHIKIADFGLSKPINDRKQLSHSFCGSPEYMAPEMLLKTGHNYLLDYYCLGALLYELVIGVPPYYSLNHDQIYSSILNQELSFPSHVQLSDQLKSLLKGLLQKNVKKRLGCMFGIKEILLHPWIGKIKQKSIENKELQPPFLPNLQAFNFDISDVKSDQQLISKKIEQDVICKDQFETFFNDEFYYQNSQVRKKIEQFNRNLCEIKPKTKKIMRKSRSVQNYLNLTNRTQQSLKTTIIPQQSMIGKPSNLIDKNSHTSRLLRKVKSSKLFNITTLRK